MWQPERNKQGSNQVQDPNKQAQEVIFRRKVNKDGHPPLTFNNIVVTSGYVTKVSRYYTWQSIIIWGTSKTSI